MLWSNRPLGEVTSRCINTLLLTVCVEHVRSHGLLGSLSECVSVRTLFMCKRDWFKGLCLHLWVCVLTLGICLNFDPGHTSKQLYLPLFMSRVFCECRCVYSYSCVCVFSHSSDLHEQTTWCCVQMFSNSHTVRLENISRPVPDILFCHYHFKIIWQQQVLTFGKVSWEMIEITIWRRSMLR